MQNFFPSPLQPYLVPGDPQDVKATPLNSTSIHVTWKPPLEKDRNGIIRGYHIHVQEMRDEVSGFYTSPTFLQGCSMYGVVQLFLPKRFFVPAMFS